MTTESTTAERMLVVAALEALTEVAKDDQIVVTNQASARIWPKLRRRPLDFHYNPSTMGGAIPLALGLALAEPRREVLVVSGDGSLLMSLGALVTVVGSGATNLSIIVLDNGMYEVTGGQKTAATGMAVDLPALARAAGFPSVASFSDLTKWRSAAARALSQPGPRFVCLCVGPTPQEYLRGATPPIAEQLAALQKAMTTAPQGSRQP